MLDSFALQPSPPLPLLAAAAAGEIALVTLDTPTAKAPARRLPSRGQERPVVVWLRVSPNSPAPDGWRSISFLRWWPDHTWIATSAEPTVADDAVASARALDRTLLVTVESEAEVAEWFDALLSMRVGGHLDA